MGHAPLVSACILACNFRAVLAVLAISGYLLLRILTRPLHVHCAYLRIYTLHTAPSICYIGFTLHCILINRFGSKLHYCVAIIHVTHILNLKQTSILSIVKWLGNGHLPYSSASLDQTDKSARFHLQQSRMFNVQVNYVDTCNNGQHTSL